MLDLGHLKSMLASFFRVFSELDLPMCWRQIYESFANLEERRTVSNSRAQAATVTQREVGERAGMEFISSRMRPHSLSFSNATFCRLEE